MFRQSFYGGLTSLFGELERLVIPVECPGCGLKDVKLCPACAEWLTGPLRRVEHLVPRLDNLSGTPMMPVWALGEYTGPARGMVVAWKDKGREDLTRVYQNALIDALAQTRTSSLFPTFDLVVPMPSSAASLRHRGRDHLAPLTRAVSQSLNVNSARPLKKRSLRDQVGLSARDRGAATITVRSHHKPPQGSRILLFDDVVTTGATLASAYAALMNDGYDVVGALVLAVTPPRHHMSVPAIPAVELVESSGG